MITLDLTREEATELLTALEEFRRMRFFEALMTEGEEYYPNEAWSSICRQLVIKLKESDDDVDLP